jgi:hypothetical protein
MDLYTAQHWDDIAKIIDEAVLDAGFEPRLVSNDDSVGIIHGRIVKNIYDDEIIVCDVSGKNPNVMFELGMRLAFDKPVVVIKDEETSYSFDTSPIEHMTYPKSLRYSDIVTFKERLSSKLKMTSETNGAVDGKSFLQHFGPIKTATISHENATEYEIIRDEIRDLKRTFSSAVQIPRLNFVNSKRSELKYIAREADFPEYQVKIYLNDIPHIHHLEIAKKVSMLSNVDDVKLDRTSDGWRVMAKLLDSSEISYEIIRVEVLKIKQQYK